MKSFEKEQKSIVGDVHSLKTQMETLTSTSEGLEQ